MSRYHGNGETCPACGETYGNFRTGLTYRDVFIMLWSVDPDPETWQHKRRRTVLGRWHALKKEYWKWHLKECEMYNTVPF